MVVELIKSVYLTNLEQDAKWNQLLEPIPIVLGYHPLIKLITISDHNFYHLC